MVEPKPSLWTVWFTAARPHTLTASISPVLVGYACAKCLGPVNYYPTTISFGFFAMLIQIGTNLHNDYADFVKGADTEKRQGQARATQKGWLTPFQTASAATLCLGVALAIGFPWITYRTQETIQIDPLMVFVVFSSVFNAFAYTGGPYPLGYIGLSKVSIAYSGLGDLFVILYFGIVATVTIPYLCLREKLLAVASDNIVVVPFSTAAANNIFQDDVFKLSFFLSLAHGCIGTAIIVVNNLRDRITDVEAGKLTMAVRFGETFARLEYLTLILIAHGCCG
mmetsp:Transcript_6748/g.10235  ORF Transcript_6748/g.10235 Transcript_6748/m.10235 type:complete len:281 (-) Transcript_6748:2395-3237(-)